MGRHKRSGCGSDAKLDQNFAPDLSRGVPGVISQFSFDILFDIKSERKIVVDKKCYCLLDNQQNLMCPPALAWLAGLLCQAKATNKSPPGPKFAKPGLDRPGLCFVHIENGRFYAEIMKYGLNQVAMPPFGAILRQNPSGPRGLGSLWDASRALKPHNNSKNLGFWV